MTVRGDKTFGPEAGGDEQRSAELEGGASCVATQWIVQCG